MDILMFHGYPPKGHPQRKEFDRSYMLGGIFLGILLIGAFVFLFVCGCGGYSQYQPVNTYDTIEDRVRNLERDAREATIRSQMNLDY